MLARKSAGDSSLLHNKRAFPQDAQKGQTSHPPNPGGYSTHPPRVCKTDSSPWDAPFRRQGRSEQLKMVLPSLLVYVLL